MYHALKQKLVLCLIFVIYIVSITETVSAAYENYDVHSAYRHDITGNQLLDQFIVYQDVMTKQYRGHIVTDDFKTYVLKLDCIHPYDINVYFKDLNSNGTDEIILFTYTSNDAKVFIYSFNTDNEQFVLMNRL